MSNEIDLIIGNEAFAQISKLLSELNKVDASFTELSTKFASLGNNTTTIKSTADLAKLTAENAKLNTIIEQQIKDYSDLNAKISEVVTKRGSATKVITEETIAQRELNKAKTLEVTASNEQIGAYARLDAQHKQAVKLAQDLAVATGRTGAEYEKAKLKANEYGAQLRVVDTDIGKHTRNVGNYASSWNGLGNSINQLTREAPAFANSLATGFMALSNNIPILADEIGVLVEKNKLLQEEGKPTTSIIKTLAGAFFSWQTAISLGVTLLTVYGAKIWDSITGAKAKEEALKKETKALEEKTKAEENDRDVIASKQSDEISRSQLLLEKAKNLSLTYKERTEAVKELKDRYPDFLKSLSDEKILAGDTADAEDRLNLALINRGFALAAQEKIQENLKEELNLRLQFGKVSEKALEIRNKESLQSQEIVVYTGKEDRAKQQKAENERNQILEQAKLYEIKLGNLRSERQSLLDVFNANSKYIGSVKEGSEATNKSKTEKEAEIEALRGTEKWYTHQISKLKEIQSTTADTTSEYKAFTNQIKLLEKALKALKEGGAFEKPAILDTSNQEVPTTLIEPKDKTDPNAWMKQYADDVKKAEEETRKLKEATDDWLKSFSSEFLQKSGMGSLETFFDGSFDKLLEGADTTQEKFAVTFNAVAEASQEMFNKIAEYGTAHYEQDYARLEAQKETSLKFAGESAIAKEKIEKDFATKKKELDKKKFEDEKKLSMVNIAIDTAQAVVATLAKGGGFFASPLAIIVAAMGAVQLGMVAAQQFPAYAEGTDNHTGGLMLVNDGAGNNYQEKIVLPNGKVIRPQGRNVLMNAPKGTKVLNHEQQLFEMLQNNNISMATQQSSGMTPSEMDEILGKHFSGIKTQNTIFDKNGFQSYIKNGNSITRSNSNRSQSVGISV